MNFLSPQYALLAGIFLSFFIQNHRIQHHASVWSSRLLQISVVLLGASLNLKIILSKGEENLFLTLASVSFVFLVGIIVTRLLSIQKEQGLLITCGTAICGGSAISALAPVIKADATAITVSLTIVFLLNAIAVFVFPLIGQSFELTQDQFGIWAALAIHDTSSVVAASALYGDQALATATTVKLTRTLWLIPTLLIFSQMNQKSEKLKITLPWFIFGFIALSLLFTFTAIPSSYSLGIKTIAKLGFSLTLFLIGLSFHWHKLKSIGLRPIGLGVGLWIMISSLTLFAILSF